MGERGWTATEGAKQKVSPAADIIMVQSGLLKRRRDANINVAKTKVVKTKAAMLVTKAARRPPKGMVVAKVMCSVGTGASSLSWGPKRPGPLRGDKWKDEFGKMCEFKTPELPESWVRSTRLAKNKNRQPTAEKVRKRVLAWAGLTVAEVLAEKPSRVPNPALPLHRVVANGYLVRADAPEETS